MSTICKSELLIKHPKIGVGNVFLALPLRFPTVSGSDHSSGFRQTRNFSISDLSRNHQFLLDQDVTADKRALGYPAELVGRNFEFSVALFWVNMIATE